jgi:hypothetical protein
MVGVRDAFRVAVNPGVRVGVPTEEAPEAVQATRKTARSKMSEQEHAGQMQQESQWRDENVAREGLQSRCSILVLFPRRIVRHEEQ